MPLTAVWCDTEVTHRSESLIRGVDGARNLRSAAAGHLPTFSPRLTWPSQVGVANDHEPGVPTMSVTVIIHFPVSDVAKAIEGLHSNAKFLEEINESTRGAGMLHHRFVAGDGELVVIDEWETAEQFQSFFDGNPKVAEVMASVGMTGPPEITVFGSIDAPGTV